MSGTGDMFLVECLLWAGLVDLIVAFQNKNISYTPSPAEAEFGDLTAGL